MTINKSAQDSFYSDDSFYDDDYGYFAKDQDDEDDDVLIEDEEDDVVLDFGDSEEEDTIVFALPDVPGAPDAGEIYIDEDGELTVENDDNVEVEIDPWDWHSGGLGKFPVWLKSMVDGVPQHSGYDIAGLERAISWFERLLKETSKAMRMDYKGEIDVALVEDGRDKIEDGIQRMIDRLERLKSSKYKRYSKKAYMEDEGLIKTAQKSARIEGIVINVSLFISRLARVIINGTVSAGHDPEDMYEKLKEEYDLTKREEAELQQLLADMGWPILQDRGLAPGVQLDKSRSDNFDFAAQYNS